MQVRIESPDAFGTNEKLHGGRRPIFQLAAAAIDDHQRAEPCDGVGQSSVRLRLGKQDGGKKHGETGNGGVPTVPQAKGQDNERRSGNGEQDAEGEPTATVAAKIQKLGQEQHERKEGAEAEVAEPGGGGFLGGSDWGRGRSHYRAFWGRVLF